MMNGIVKEILELNRKFFELVEYNANLELDEFIDKVDDLVEEKNVVSQKLRDRVEAFVDFLYRDHLDLYSKLLEEASKAESEDDNTFPTDFERLDPPDLIVSYILIALSYDYDYKGPVYKDIFENNYFENNGAEASL